MIRDSANVAYLHREVNMIAHQTEGKNTVPESLVRFVENFVETEAVPIVRKDFLAGVAPEDNMINCPRRVYTRFSWHNKKLPHIFKSSRPDPIALPDGF